MPGSEKWHQEERRSGCSWKQCRTASRTVTETKWGLGSVTMHCPFIPRDCLWDNTIPFSGEWVCMCSYMCNWKWWGMKLWLQISVCVHRKQRNFLEGYRHNYYFSALTFCLQTNALFIEQVHIRGINCGYVTSFLQWVIVKYHCSVISKEAGLLNIKYHLTSQKETKWMISDLLIQQK